MRLKAQRRQEYRDRIPIEGKFGQGKYGYRFNNIRAKQVLLAVFISRDKIVINYYLL